MTTHTMKLGKEQFDKIVNGLKIIESRLCDEKRRLIRLGDKIEFSLSSEPSKMVLTKVTALHTYSSFDELFSNFPAREFGGDSVAELHEEISQFYSVDEQDKYGVVGIQINLVTPDNI